MIASGFPNLDEALGGGYPRGQIIEFFGEDDMIALAMSAMIAAQTTGSVSALMDMTRTFDAARAQRLGVRMEKLIMSQPDDGEQALAIVEALVRSGAVDLVIVDSVAALVPQEKDDGLQARMMSHALRKLTAAVTGSRTAVIFINRPGPSEVTANALKYYASIRIDIRRVGSVMRALVVKNATTDPARMPAG